MRIKTLISSGLTVAAILFYALPASAQSFRVQCPARTALHPNGSNVDAGHPGQVKCQQIAGGDGFATMGDGHQIYLFGFAPLSGLGDPANAAAKPGILTGKPGTQTPDCIQ